MLLLFIARVTEWAVIGQQHKWLERQETGVKLVGDYNSPYLFVREEMFHDIRRRGMRKKGEKQRRRDKNWNSSSAQAHEAIPNKIKWDIDELVLKVNDLLRLSRTNEQRWLCRVPSRKVISYSNNSVRQRTGSVAGSNEWLVGFSSAICEKQTSELARVCVFDECLVAKWVIFCFSI